MAAICLAAMPAPASGPLPMPAWPTEAETGTRPAPAAADPPPAPRQADPAPPPVRPDTETPAGETSLPPARAGMDPPAGEAAPPHPDPVTRQHMEILQGSGLLARQSAISESIIMLERQLKQAELLNRLMALGGPDMLIEVSPGEFRSFADTPAGQRLAMEQEESRLLARIRILELQAQEADLAGTMLPDAAPKPGPDKLDIRDIVAPKEPEHSYVLQEIRGSDGKHSALLEIDGEPRQVRKGDRVPGEMTVLAVGEDSVRLSGRGRIVILRLDV